MPNFGGPCKIIKVYDKTGLTIFLYSFGNLWPTKEVNSKVERNSKMPRSQKGQRPQGSGRKPGTPNKKTAELMEVLVKHDFEPAEALIYIYKEAKKIFEFRKKKSNLAGALTAMDRMHDAASELAGYVYPKKKAIEHSGEIGVKTFSDFIETGLDDDDEGDE